MKGRFTEVRDSILSGNGRGGDARRICGECAVPASGDQPIGPQNVREEAVVQAVGREPQMQMECGGLRPGCGERRGIVIRKGFTESS